MVSLSHSLSLSGLTCLCCMHHISVAGRPIVSPQRKMASYDGTEGLSGSDNETRYQPAWSVGHLLQPMSREAYTAPKWAIAHPAKLCTSPWCPPSTIVHTSTAAKCVSPIVMDRQERMRRPYPPVAPPPRRLRLGEIKLEEDRLHEFQTALTLISDIPCHSIRVHDCV